MQIRHEISSDFEAIFDLVRTAFMTAKVSSGDEQNFVNRLRAGDGYIPSLAFVALDDLGEPIGHIMLTKTFIQSVEAGEIPLLLLAPLSVKIEHRNKGVGTALIRYAFDQAKASGHRAVVVVGDPAYYARFGFKSASSFGVTNANAIPDPYVMLCELAEGALLSLSGSITFQT